MFYNIVDFVVNFFSNRIENGGTKHCMMTIFFFFLYMRIRLLLTQLIWSDLICKISNFLSSINDCIRHASYRKNYISLMLHTANRFEGLSHCYLCSSMLHCFPILQSYYSFQGLRYFLNPFPVVT